MALLEWLAVSALAKTLAAYPTLYILVNAAHIAAIGLLVGAILPLDLRILGAFRAYPMDVLGPFLSRAGMAGVALTILSGAVLFAAKPLEYVVNPAFLTKMLLLTAGIANAAVLHFNKNWRQAIQSGPVTASVKGAAIFSMLCWSAAVIAGRWIGFL